MIQSVYLSTSSRLSMFFSIIITGQWGIGIRLVAGRVATIMAALLQIFSLDLLDLIDFTAWYGFLGDDIEHLVLFLKSFQILIPFFSDFLYCFTVSDLPPVDPARPSLVVSCLVLLKNSLQHYATYTFTQEFLTSCIANSGAGYRDAWAPFCWDYWVGHQSLTSSS